LLDVDGIKDSEGNADRLLLETTRSPYAVFTGSAALLPVAKEYGATGAILALANLMPELCASAFVGDVDAQRELISPHLELRAGGVATIKRRLSEHAGAPGRGADAAIRSQDLPDDLPPHT
jgi:dihydrodipicolinate synthase/N-acetylneuraminate lyase